MNKQIMFLMPFIILLIIPNALAIYNTGHMYLLAVSGDDENETGSVADLYLDVKPGSGRVFLDTYPLTKIDTQFSTRLANSIACDYLDKSCQNLDFFYTIKSRSAIVGGPSAGAAITILTISMLDEINLPDNMAVTGTINAGGLIGPVGGIDAKVAAAEKEGLKIVMIPKINVANTTEDNLIFDDADIRVEKVSSIDDAMFILTGKRKFEDKNIDVSPLFIEIMKKISEQMCNQTRNLLVDFTNTTEETMGKELYSRGVNASANGSYYSSASFCFGANVQLRRLDLRNKTDDELFMIYSRLKDDLDNFEDDVDSLDIDTIDDLQTYMIVKERIKDSREYIDEVEVFGFSNISSDSLAYSIERYNSALSWSNFFGTGKKEYVLNKQALNDACINKISEAETYEQYLMIYIDIPLTNIDMDIKDAQDNFVDEEYELCISKASKAKAEISLIIEAMSISEERVNDLFDEKLKIAKQSIVAQQQKDVFPILGYSYYEYAQSLNSHDIHSALLYTEYSIELSNIGIYFEQKENLNISSFDYGRILIFVTGLMFGSALTLLITLPLMMKKRRR